MNITNTANQNGGFTTNLCIAAGETVAESITVSSGTNPLDLTGYSLKMQVDFPAPLLLNTGNGGITITDATQGTFQINIADSVSAGLSDGGYPYDLWMVSGGGQAMRLLAGMFHVNPSIAAIP